MRYRIIVIIILCTSVSVFGQLKRYPDTSVLQEEQRDHKFIKGISFFDGQLLAITNRGRLLTLDTELNFIKSQKSTEFGLSNYINQIFTGKPGRFWLSTVEGFVFDPLAKSRAYYDFKSKILNVSSVGENTFVAVENDQIWAFNDFRGTTIGDKSQIRIKKNRGVQGEGLKNVAAFVGLEITQGGDKRKVVFFGGNQGLMAISQSGQGSGEAIPQSYQREIKSIVPYKKGFYFSSQNNDSIHYFSNSPQIEFGAIELPEKVAGTGSIEAMLIDPWNNLWVVFNNKIFLTNIEDSSLKVTLDKSHFLKFNSLVANSITSSEQHVYVATDGVGIFRFDIPQVTQNDYDNTCWSKIEEEYYRGIIKNDTVVILPYTEAQLPPDTLVLDTEKVLTQVKFDESSAKLKIEAKDVLKSLAIQLRIAQELASFRIVVNGHTSKERNTRERTAKQLSQNRANVVRNYLLEYGLEPENIESFGLGDTVPVDTVDLFSPKNRRVTLKIVRDG